MPLINCIPCFCQPCSTFKLVIFLMGFVVYVPKIPLWVESMPSLNPCELESYEGFTLLAFRQIKFQYYSFIKSQKQNERLCIVEVGVDPEPLCSCPRTRCGTYHESFLQGYLIIWIILPVLWIGSLVVMVPTIFPPGSHLLGKLKLLILCKSFALSNLYSDLPSGITPSTCYLQV